MFQKLLAAWRYISIHPQVHLIKNEVLVEAFRKKRLTCAAMVGRVLFWFFFYETREIIYIRNLRKQRNTQGCHKQIR